MPFCRPANNTLEDKDVWKRTGFDFLFSITNHCIEKAGNCLFATIRLKRYKPLVAIMGGLSAGIRINVTIPQVQAGNHRYL